MLVLSYGNVVVVVGGIVVLVLLYVGFVVH